MMRLVPAFALLATLAACEVTTPPPPSRIGGAQFITFRCAPRVVLPADGFPALQGPGAPLDACGCTQYLDDGMLGLLDAAGCVTGNAEVRAYVAGNSVGEVAVVRLNRGPGTGEARILDSDETVPGVTGIFVDDIISDIEADPDGRFVIAVNATSGTLAFVVDDFALQPELVIEPGLGPLASIAVWPPIERGLDRQDAALVRPELRRAWITAPTSRRILELDLAQVSALLDGGAVDPESLVTRIYDMPGAAVPAAIAVHPEGHRLYVGHAAEPGITEFDVETGEARGFIDLSRRTQCADGYLVNVLARDDDESCRDGYDNDDDGMIDDADPDCDGAFGIEWPDGACPQRAECADGVDNNGDGTIDGDDPTCDGGTGRWEGAPPACSNGEDDDGDGQADRDDLGCTSEGDEDELPFGDGLETGDECLDGVDNDGDGLIDIAEDPGCSDAVNAAARYAEERPSACADGLDNDGDGLTDYLGGDPDCYAAADDAEGASRIELGPREILTAGFIINGRRFNYLYTTEAVGYVVSVDLDDETLRARYTGLDRTALNLALRQHDGSNALMAIVSDSSLRWMQITTPAQLRTEGGRDVFARLDPSYDLVRLANRVDIGVRVDAFYTIHEGTAARIRALDNACPPIAPAEDGTCTEGLSPVGGACAPTTCASEEECPGGFACLAGGCARICDDDAECGGGELCDPAIVDGASDRVCQSRCRLDDRGLVAMVPPRDPCAEGNCDAACVDSAECGADLACIDGTCQSWCRANACDAPFDPESAPPVEPGRTEPLGDPLAMRAERSWITHDEINVRRFAHQRVPRVSVAPRLFVRSAPVANDFDVFPSFCRIPQPGADSVAFPGWPAGDCVPQGKAVTDSGGLVDQTDEQIDAELSNRVDGYPYLQVLENRPGRLPSQEFSLAYEGVLPRSESRTGQHAGIVPIDLDPERVREGAPTTVDGWVLVDYDQNFCNVGVEVDDVLLVDRMVPADPEDADLQARCTAAFPEVNITLPPNQRRDPLRYRVVEVAPFKLVLRPDGVLSTDTVSYASEMLQRGGARQIPALAPAPDAPAVECMAGLSTYRIRSGESFILVGNSSGYRHPWVRRGAQCVQDAQRLDRYSRARMEVPFENEWFRFRLGAADPTRLGSDPQTGLPSLPFLVDVVLTFQVDGGELVRRMSSFSSQDLRWLVTPQDMRWLPNSDLLYVVDGAIQTLVEISGLDVLRHVPVVTNTSYD